MKRNTKEIIIKGILLSLIPAVCSYLSQKDNILDWLQNYGYISIGLKLDLFRQIMNITSIILTFIILTVPLIVANIKSNTYQTQRDELIKNYKETFETTLKNQLNLEHCKLNVRIFVPRKTLRTKICKWLKIKIKCKYYIKNIAGLAENDITENLNFEVYPNSQGLVGECYKSKVILYDDDLENSNEHGYNLTHYQIAKTNRLKFILVRPLFSENEEIISIISLDTCDKIKIQEESKDILRQLVLYFTQSLYECIPDLFKAKGGIW